MPAFLKESCLSNNAKPHALVTEGVVKRCVLAVSLLIIHRGDGLPRRKPTSIKLQILVSDIKGRNECLGKRLTCRMHIICDGRVCLTEEMVLNIKPTDKDMDKAVGRALFGRQKH